MLQAIVGSCGYPPIHAGFAVAMQKSTVVNQLSIPPSIGFIRYGPGFIKISLPFLLKPLRLLELLTTITHTGAVRA
jgi:hypothetical protein